MATCLRYPGKVVIVTGGTRGIGLAIMREFVRQGANVVFCSRACGAERGQAIQRELQDSGCPGEAFYQVCDVTNEADIQRLILVTIERYGCLDCLVNNAADVETGTIDDVTAEDFRNMMEVNVVSCLLTSKYSLPYLRETRGNIINIGSLRGVIGGKNLLSYNTSKGAVIAMTKALAIDESKYGVRVNSLSPGNIWTPMWEKYASQNMDPKATIREAECHQLLGRFGTPEEVALGVLYLAADGTFCTGFNLVISGGAEVGFGTKDVVDPQPGKICQGANVVFCSRTCGAMGLAQCRSCGTDGHEDPAAAGQPTGILTVTAAFANIPSAPPSTLASPPTPTASSMFLGTAASERVMSQQ
ncbi:17-beta-hydroxysteroid dehydrogenase 14-like [Eublepharis macularius]|uniref:17-beta-hydroxysteroid dehydrogenase 14-like n=1 Tax=Eublepharis macularius TaxID=481883 RepID=A0AA97K4V4_EUBMA|nr:17-beta-hydroxysteroid dehydrogenase 14-like [Eublepharis macularius]